MSNRFLKLLGKSGDGGGVAQGPGNAIADNEVVRGDTTGVQGSTLILNDTGEISSTSGVGIKATNSILQLETDGAGSTLAIISDGPLTMDDNEGYTHESQADIFMRSRGQIDILSRNNGATIGATQAGKNVAISASPAIASTDTDGAAAGGAVTITAGAAARRTSGNADGGAINLNTGAGIGSGAKGSLTTDATMIVGGANVEYRAASGIATLGHAGQAGSLSGFWVTDTGTGALGTNNLAFPITWAGATLGLSGVVAGVLAIGSGAGGSVAGWMQWAGESRVATNQTNDTTTPASTTLSVTLKAGRSYSFKCTLFVSDSVAAEGARIDFDGGSATMTAFRAHAKITDAALITSLQTTALATDVTAATVTGDALIEVSGAMTVDQAGTFIPRFAQNTHATGTITLYALSHMIVFDMP